MNSAYTEALDESGDSYWAQRQVCCHADGRSVFFDVTLGSDHDLRMSMHPDLVAV